MWGVMTDEGYGRMSGIPPCCRQWYITVWQPLCESGHRGNLGRYRPNCAQFEPEWVIGYIRCPGCRRADAWTALKYDDGSTFERKQNFTIREMMDRGELGWY